MVVDAEDRRGGLALMWDRNSVVTVKSYSSHHIEAYVEEDSGYSWRFVGFYGHHEASKRRLSWELLRHVASLSQLPSLFMGDFNEVCEAKEHFSLRCQRPAWQMRNFNQAVRDCGLVDLGFKGYPFTWCSNFLSPYTTRTRIDRGLASEEWRSLFPEAEVSHLSTFHSDHLPLFLNLGSKFQGYKKQKPRFRFEESWCLYEESKEVVQEAWNSRRVEGSGFQVFTSIKESRLKLLQWKREFLGNFQTVIAAKQAELDVLQQGVITDQTKQLAVRVAREIDRRYEANDIYWKIRAKAEWAQKGDRNTGFFHAVAVQRGRISFISSLVDEEGRSVTNILSIHAMAVSFYQKLFSSDARGPFILGPLQFVPRLDAEALEILAVPFSEVDVKKGLFAMKGSKSPGPDGMSSKFFQFYWDTVGPDICRMTLESVNEGRIFRKDDTLLLGSATIQEVTVFKEILNQYEGWSGQLVWRLLLDPESALARVYRAKYFPRGSYWTAELGAKPSYTWRSLLSVREIMRQGVKAQIGDGENTLIWQNRWLNHTCSGRPITPSATDFQSAKVVELIDSEIGMWNITKVRAWFFEVDCIEILKLPLNKLHLPDQYQWVASSKGEFTVRSAYAFIVDLGGSDEVGQSNNPSHNPLFSVLCKLKIPGKVKHFVWRLLHNNLPTKDNLARRQIPLIKLCDLCQEQEETCMHLFHQCRYVKEINNILHLPINGIVGDSFQDLFRIRKRYLPIGNFRLWLTCLWMVWEQRNKLRLEGLLRSATEVVGAAIAFLSTVDSAAEVLNRLRPSE